MSNARLDAQSHASNGMIAVTILLTGGQQFTVTLTPQQPLLQKLVRVLTETPSEREKYFFQVPLDPASELYFTGDRLVGLVTAPPLREVLKPSNIQSDLQSDLQPQTSAFASNSPGAAPWNAKQTVQQTVQPSKKGDRPLVSASPSGQTPAAAESSVIPAQFVQILHVLTVAEQHRLLSYVLHHKNDFVPSSTSTGEKNYRRSLVLHTFPEFADLIRQRVADHLPQIFSALNLSPFPAQEIEAQLTAHNDGHYYRVHNDNGSLATANRQISYVYYFYREPKPFTGGQLRLYDSKLKDYFYVQAESSQLIEPINNSLIFFLSHNLHEVLPIVCPSQTFADSRFTINGWIRE